MRMNSVVMSCHKSEAGIVAQDLVSQHGQRLAGAFA
jgi:hypothetical protein